MSQHYGVSELARALAPELGRPVRPREISDLIYQRLVPEDKCPLVSGRRLIPAELVPAVRRLLAEKGSKKAG